VYNTPDLTLSLDQEIIINTIEVNAERTEQQLPTVGKEIDSESLEDFKDFNLDSIYSCIL